jgi:hypothetical protein
MLEKSDTSVPETLKTLNAFNLDVGLIVPTDIGLEKSIMDATASLRDYLQETAFHNYGTQEQGPDAKVVKRAYFVWPDSLEETTVSLCRPVTKKGDPRIWFSKLGAYADPFNLLAILVRGDAIYLVNCSNEAVMASLRDQATPLGELAMLARPPADPAVAELLELMLDVGRRGYVRTMRPGDTGIGMTLETLLGISANARKTPDYKGIEIKAKRLRNGRENRITLFSQVPNWGLSPIGSAWNLLQTYGYVNNGKRRLNHEMSALRPNSIGFVLEVDAAKDWLKQKHYDPATTVTNHVATWEMDKLRERLREKHPQTFWVGARCRGRGDAEEFHYIQVEHTKQPKVRNFDALLEGGIISVDYLMSEKGTRVRDHGYLFKMHAADFDALFPPSEKYVLA